MSPVAHCSACSSPLAVDDLRCPVCSAEVPTMSSVTGDLEVVPTPAPLADPEGEKLRAELARALAPGLHVLRALGQGGMGRVYLARDPALKRMVAIKVLTPALADDPVAHARFLREAEAVAMVQHPNIVGVYQVGELPRSGAPYFVMQFVEGTTLDEEFPEGTPVPEATARRIVGEVASALSAAHARGLVHRDIKPRNIMLDRGSGRAIVLDFGISAALDTHVPSTDRSRTKLTSAGAYLGTPIYMSPEQASAESVGDRSDVYSLGVVAFEMLTGRVPFEGNSAMQVMAAHLKDVPPAVSSLRPDVDEHFATLVDRCLEKAPDARPAAAEVADYLVPSSQNRVEWPPPGLERLRGLGSRLFAALGFTAVWAFSFFILLALQPTFSSPRWSEGERSGFWRAVSEPGRILTEAASRALDEPTSQAVDAAPVWLFLLGLTLVGLTASLPAVARRGWRLADRLRWARRSGYPWPVLADVAWDNDPDTAAVLNHTGLFALLDDPARRRLLRMRRLRRYLLAGTLLLAVLGPLLWVLGLTGGWSARTTAVVPLGELLAAAGPPLLGLAALLWVRRAERRITRRVRPRGGWNPLRRREHPPVRRELVSAWLASAGRGRAGAVRATAAQAAAAAAVTTGGGSGPTTGSTLTPSMGIPALRPSAEVIPPAPRWVPRALMAALPVLLTLLVLGSALVAMLVVFVVRGRLAPTRARAESWVAALASDSLRPMRWQELDSLVARSAGEGSGQGTVAGGLAAARLLARRASFGGGDAPWDADTAAPGDWGEDSTVVDADLVNDVFAQLPAAPPAEDLAELARDTASRWLPVWRELAASPPLPPLWGYRTGLPGVANPFELPPHATALALQELAERNRAAAALALARGDKAGAVRRARENVAAARHLLRSPILIDVAAGAAIADRAARALGEVGRATGDRALAEDADRLKEALRRFRAESRLALDAFLALMSDPAEPAGLRYLPDTTLPVAVRTGLLNGVVTGYCLNAREILFGVDPRRSDALQRAATLLADVPRSADLVGLDQRWLARLLDDPAAALAPLNSTTPGIVKSLGWVGLTDVQARLTFCSQPF